MEQFRTAQAQGNSLRFLRSRKVVTLAALASHLRCSSRSVQRRLAQWQAIHSYNQNGRYYTLPDIPDFDANGLWRYRGAFFSRFGNLPETFVQLVAHSQAGLTAPEAGALLGLRPSSFLWSLSKHSALKREKHHGLYVYFSSDPIRYNSQREHRLQMARTPELPTDFEAVAILVEKIKYPHLSADQLSRQLKKQNLSVHPDIIENLFHRHGLAEKKTPHSR